MNYWLMKSEPDVFSIDHLKNKVRSGWDGVRNYQARNYMRDLMKVNDTILFYHSSCEFPGIAGLAIVSKESHPDPSQFDKRSKYYDPKSTLEKPRWYMVEVEFYKKLNTLISLKEIKETKGLETMIVAQKGSRLSINPVQKREFEILEKLFV
jgi:predicted RNA-binding protein with PUA-like domain